MTARVYKNMTLLEGSDFRIRENAYLVVEQGAILEIGEGWRGDGIDMGGAIVLPAFVDAHTHLADHAIKDVAVGHPTVEAVSPPDGLKYRYLQELSFTELTAALREAMTECLRSGIVACGDFREGGAEGVRALREASDELPFRAVAYGDATCLPSDLAYVNELGSVWKTAEGVGVGDIVRFDDADVASLKARLGHAGKRLAAHTAETQEAQRACLSTWGESEVTRILKADPDLLVHMTCPQPGDLEAIAEAGVPVACCTRTNAILGDGLPPVVEMLSLGIPVALGTDNMMFTSPDMFREMDWVSRLIRGVSRCADRVDSVDVLRAATLGGARALGLEEELGTLEAGKAACFLGLDSSSINLRETRNVHASVVHRAGIQDVAWVVAWGVERVARGQEAWT